MRVFRSEVTTEEYRRLEYEVARREGERRFGSDCRHEATEAGRCKQCLRKVVA